MAGDYFLPGLDVPAGNKATVPGLLLSQDLLFPHSFCLLLGWQRGCEKEGTTGRLGVGG